MMSTDNLPGILMASGCLFLCLAWGAVAIINAFRVK